MRLFLLPKPLFRAKTILFLGAIHLLIHFPMSALAEGRAIAVLEYRSAVGSAPEIATQMAAELQQMTSNRSIGPSEARLKFGPSLDAEVARCNGDAECIARIGGKLDCDEVILVGLSQLGDLIVAVQRIEVKTGQVISRMADSITRERRLRRGTITSYLRRLLPASDFKRYGQIQIKTDEKGDEVFLDDTFAGKTPLEPLRVPAPGRYSVKVTRPGHEDFIAKLDIFPEANVEVTPSLSKKLASANWYQQWWIWALIGGAVTAGITTAIVVTQTKSPDSIPALIRIDP
jgi:hypothetical protein